MSSLPLAALGSRGGFARDARFGGSASQPAPAPRDDPVALAYAQGLAEGEARARAEAEERREADDQARGRIELSLARLEPELAEELRQRLYLTVEALCESALAPLALDADALAARAARAAAMLARADDERVLRLHPDDLALIASRLPDGLECLPDPGLPRGTVRVEGGLGGIEDGPDQWRRAVAEALGEC